MQAEKPGEPDAAYDFIVCGGGTSGCVVARRLAENPAARVLLLEAGGDDAVDSVRNATRWMSNIGSVRDWQFEAEPSAALARPPPRPADGQGVGRRLQHQRAHLGAGPQERFRQLGRASRRRRLELCVGVGTLQAD